MESSASIPESPRILSAPVPASIRLAALPGDAPPPNAPSGLLLLESHSLPTTREVLTRSVRLLQSPEDAREQARVVLDFDPAAEELTLHHLLVLRDGVARESVAPEAFRFLPAAPPPAGRDGDGRLSAVVDLEDLRTGDRIDLAYTVRNRVSIFEGRCFFVFDLGWPYPVGEAIVTATLPAGSPSAVRAVGLGSEPRREKGPDGGERLVWNLRNPRPLRREENVPSWHLPAPHVETSDFADWNEVATRIHQAWDPALRRGAGSEEFESLVADLKAAHNTPAAYAQAAAQFTQDQIRTCGPRGDMRSYLPANPDAVLSRRSGDSQEKAMLLCALLRAGGMTAWPTLVHSALQHTLAGFLPSPAAFNHVIVCLRIGKQYFWVDPAIPAQGGTLETRVLPRFVQGLIVHPQSKGLVKLPKPAPDSGEILVHEEYTINFRALSARLTVTTTARGTEADSLRGLLVRLGHDGAEREFLRARQKCQPGTERASELEIEDDRSANRLVLRESFHVPGVVASPPNSRQRFLRLPGHLVADRLAEPSETRREHPLNLPFPNRVLHSISASIPPEMELAGTRNSHEGPGFTFSTSRRTQSGRLEIRHAYTATANRVEPADFALYANKIRRVGEALDAVVPLPLPSLGRKSRSLLGIGAAAALLGIIGLVLSIVTNDGGRKPASPFPIDGDSGSLSTLGGESPDATGAPLSNLEGEPVDDGEAFDKLLNDGIRNALTDPGTVEIGGPSLLEAREFDLSLDPGASNKKINRSEGIPSRLD